MLVRRTLTGCKRLRGQPTSRKRALTLDDLRTVAHHYSLITPSHDDLLFQSQLLTGFFALMRLGELTIPDDRSLVDPRKITSRLSVAVSETDYRFFLPGHKADKFFEGNTILIQKLNRDIDPWSHFTAYLSSRDRLFPFSLNLWLREDGTSPTRSFFMTRLRFFFGPDIVGQSMRAGGATSLAQAGVPPHLIPSHRTMGFTGLPGLHKEKPCSPAVPDFRTCCTRTRLTSFLSFLFLFHINLEQLCVSPPHCSLFHLFRVL